MVLTFLKAKSFANDIFLCKFAGGFSSMPTHHAKALRNQSTIIINNNKNLT